MQPSGAERLTFLLLFGGAAVVTLLLARLLPNFLHRLSTVRHSIAAPSLIAIGVTAATVMASAWFMFLSSHDLRVFVAALSLGIGLAVVLSRALSERLEKGDKKLGIFYGAAHMPDFEQRLQKLGFKLTRKQWRTAWDIRPSQKKPATKPAKETVKKPTKRRRRII